MTLRLCIHLLAGDTARSLRLFLKLMRLSSSCPCSCSGTDLSDPFNVRKMLSLSARAMGWPVPLHRKRTLNAACVAVVLAVVLVTGGMYWHLHTAQVSNFAAVFPGEPPSILHGPSYSIPQKADRMVSMYVLFSFWYLPCRL